MKRFRHILLLSAVCIAAYVSANAQTAIQLPAIPDSLRQPVDRASYLVEHFWDEVDFSGRNPLPGDAELEQAFVDQLSVMHIATDVAQNNAVKNLVERASAQPSVLNSVLALAQKYLFQLDSPFASDAFYQAFIDNALTLDDLGQSQRTRMEAHREILQKNLPGTLASDFTFTTADGKTERLHELQTDGSLLLLFYDPDCSHCKEVMRQLSSDAKIRQMLDDGRLSVFAVYSGDEKEEWLASLNLIPKGWLVGYEDGTLQDNDIYVFRTMPTVFLLDKNKNVLLKDTSLQKLLTFLEN